MLRRLFMGGAVIGAAIVSTVLADSMIKNPLTFDPFNFHPLAESAYGELTTDPKVLDQEPWKLPEGYTQTVVSDGSALTVFPRRNWNDMNTLNETGRLAGRYLYRTHELSPKPGTRDGFVGSAVSVVDLETGKAKVLVQRPDWEGLDGIVWTPWGSVLVTEETSDAKFSDPLVPGALRGLVYETMLDPKDPTKSADVIVRPMLGSMSHEGIDLDTLGNIYEVEEHPSGSIYKFVPEKYGDLSKGQLYVLKVDDRKTKDGTGPAEWVALDMALAQKDARAAAAKVGASTYVLAEDIERIGDVLYVAVTGEARVLAVGLSGKPWVRNFVKAGMNVPVEDRRTQISGFKSPDNLANGPDGTLWIVEDNTPSDIWVAQPDHDGDGASDSVQLFGSLRDQGAEGTGIYFGNDLQTLLVNIQHSATGNDKTIAIRKKKD